MLRDSGLLRLVVPLMRSVSGTERSCTPRGFAHDPPLRCNVPRLMGCCCSEPRRLYRQPGLVQGELAAVQDGRSSGCRTSRWCRTTSPSTRRLGRLVESRRAVGQARLRHPRPGLRRVGRPPSRRRLRSGRYLRQRPQTAVVVPRGVGNAFQTAGRRDCYSYLVNDHWSQAAKDSYTFWNLADGRWPSTGRFRSTGRSCRTPTGRHPRLSAVTPTAPPRRLVTGVGGHLGRSPATAWPDATGLTRADVDLTDPRAVASLDLSGYGLVVHAAAYTAVDAAETEQGRRDAWATNVSAVTASVRAAREHRTTLVQVSSDYVFDGSIVTSNRGSRSHRWVSTDRPRRPVTRWSPPCHGTTCPGPAG